MFRFRILLPLALGALFVACADDGGSTPADLGAKDRPVGDTQRPDGAPTPDARRDGARDQASTDIFGTVDLGQPRDTGPKLDGPVVSKLPPPPAGAVILRISVQDTVGNHGPGELRLKGAFKYDATTNVITPDSNWSGPAVGLYDDGPNGYEGIGSQAGDRKLGAVVYVVPTASTTLEYGIESPAGWMWPEQNASVTFKPGDSIVDLTSTKVAPRNGVDLIVKVERSKLAGRSFDPGFETVTLRGNATHWAPLPCNDFGEAGDTTKDDGIFTCRLSMHIGATKRFPHLGLLRPGAKLRFLIDLGGNAYSETAGVSAQLQDASSTVGASLAKVSGNLELTVPANLKDRVAPAPPALGLPSGKRGDLDGGRYDLNTTSAGIAGSYYVPSWYDAHSELPLLVALHGATEKGSWMINVWEQLAQDQGFVLLAPTSFGATSWNWVYGKTPTEENAILAAVAWLKGRYVIDAGHVGVNGFSDGASMALRMGLNNPSVFAGIMANSAGSPGTTYKATPPIKIYLSHGQADAILPYSNALSIKSNLVSLGFDVTWISFPTGHAYQYHVFPTAEKIPMLRWLAAAAR